MEELKENVEFVIKNKPVQLKIYIAFTIVSVAFAVMLVLVIVAFHIAARDRFIWFVELIPAVSLAMSVFGIYIYRKEEFSLKNGEFKIVKVFKRKLIIRADSIYCVWFRPYGYGTQIEFMNKKGEITAQFFDDGTMMQEDIFLENLDKLKIPVRRNGYGNE